MNSPKKGDVDLLKALQKMEVGHWSTLSRSSPTNHEKKKWKKNKKNKKKVWSLLKIFFPQKINLNKFFIFVKILISKKCNDL